MKLRYLLNRKSPVELNGSLPVFDIFVSAFNDSERVRTVYRSISATRKCWVVLPEYNYADAEIASMTDFVCRPQGSSEADIVMQLAEQLNLNGCNRPHICVDITGFMRPQILYLLRYLYDRNIRIFDMIYSEPMHYARKEYTAFSNEEILAVRQVIGYEGIHVDNVEDDVLIVGVGYDDALISRVSNDKDGARLIQLLSLPSLSADMYQESILRLDKTGSSFDPNNDGNVFFAPANDPFVVAYELSEKVREVRDRTRISNIYLSPLATKPQALGFGIFYLHEMLDSPASIIFPIARYYNRETGTGVGRIWRYEIHL